MKISREGYRIIALTAAIVLFIGVLCFSLIPTWIATIITVILIVHFGLVVWFFRVPKRPYVADDNIVYSPADGKIVVIEEIKETEYLNQQVKQVSVFMSITNVHANWYPVGGTIEYFKHHHGRFLMAWNPKSSEENERTTIVVNTGQQKILFRQIAGFVARRIVSYVKTGTEVKQNEKCGFIKFGSRLDIMLPLDAEILVELDQKVTGSQTPIARLK